MSKQPPFWIDQDSKRGWMNPLDPAVVDRVLRKVNHKNGLYNGYVGAMRLALQLMVRMMADPDPVIASTAALNLMRSDGYSGLVGLPAIKTALQRVKKSIVDIQNEQTKMAAPEVQKREWPEGVQVQEMADPLTRELMEKLGEGEEEYDGTGSDQA